ncbi:FUSC family protein [Yinghuangia seranimata]|uniref:FUSC family protein n=1 Tax=Yinghuangia seranimata TaxID=408067 RepID=UPI00248AC3FE|nr:FUSC family protein [Yinghuangia seranimata]MDI2131322.1 FUSC family protein [Yinghuangia seranimata]
MLSSQSNKTMHSKLREAGAAAATTAASLALAFWAGLWLKRAAGLGDSIVVLTVAITVTLARTQRETSWRRALFGLALLPFAAVGAAEVGWLLAKRHGVGDTLWLVGVAGAIWVRRFGPRAAEFGTLVTLPLVAVLVSPVPPGDGPVGRVVWSAAAAGIAFASVAFGRIAARAVGIGTTRQPAVPRSSPERGAGRSRLPASTRMALQMAAASGAAFLVGRLAYPDHWTWTVLTAFLVCSGNRGRGDVVHKSVLRVAGAAVGTVLATLCAGAFSPGDHASVAVILAVLVVASCLRTFSYAYWAGCVTAVLSLLYGYYGQTGTGLLRTRLEEIVVGAAIGVAASWFVLPVRSGDVARRRIADALAALGDVLAHDRRNRADEVAKAHARFNRSVAQLGEIAAPFDAHHRIVRWWRPQAAHPADAIAAVRSCAEPVRAIATRGPDDGFAERAEAVSANIVATRLAIGRRPGRPHRELPPPRPHLDTAVAAAHAALSTIDTALIRVTRVYPPQPPANA